MAFSERQTLHKVDFKAGLGFSTYNALCRKLDLEGLISKSVRIKFHSEALWSKIGFSNLE